MENGKRIVALHILGISLIASLFGSLLVFDLFAARVYLSRPLFSSLLGIGIALNFVLFLLEILFRIREKEPFYKCLITAYLLLIFFAAILLVLLKTGFFEIVRDAEAFQSYLERTGGWMRVAFISLQFLQVVILPIPSAVTVVAGAALFKPFWGSVYSLIGIVLGSLAAFLIGRYAGNRVVAWMIGKETLEKWMKKIKGKDKLFLTAMFLLPVFPDDVLCFVAGMSSMSVWYFLIVIVISRVLAIFTTSYSVTLIPFDTWWGLTIWGVFGVGVAVLFFVLYKKSDAILQWFEKKFHRETRVKENRRIDEFTLEVVDPDGSVHSKGVKREGEDPPARPAD